MEVTGFDGKQDVLDRTYDTHISSNVSVCMVG